MEVNKIYFYHDFKKISYVVWKRILQDLLNYHMIKSDLEWAESMNDKYMQIKTYIDHNGILPDSAKEQSLIDTIDLLKKQIEELKSLNSLSSTSKSRIKQLEEELKKNEDELIFFNKYIKDNICIYKNKVTEQQFFSKRKTALIIQEKMVLNLVDDINFSKTITIKKINTLTKRIKKQIPFDNFDIELLYKYIKQYIDVILTTDDNGYDFLQKNLFLDY